MDLRDFSLGGLEDVFSGNQGSQSQGDPSSAGAGDGDKSIAITNYLAAITGVYEAVTGSGHPAGPAPAAQTVKPGGPNFLIIGGIVAGLLVLFFLLKRK